MARPTKSARNQREKQKEKEADDQAKRGLVALGILVAALAGLVWWASTSGQETSTGDRDADVESTNESESASASASTTAKAGAGAAKPEAGATRATGSIERLPEAGGDLMVLTDKSDEAIAAIANVEAIGKALDVPYCGPACDAVKKLIADKEHFEVETLTGDQMILPPKDTIDTIAPGLTPKERESVHGRRAAVTVKVRGDADKNQVPARALFGITAMLADKLDGLVWDETTRRVENAAQTKKRAITVPLGASVFEPQAIVIQFYRQPDATARLVTLGMNRFGVPDLSLRGCSMAAGAMLVDAINLLAKDVVDGKDALPLTVETKNGSASFEVADAERVQGDPDDFIELVPVGGQKGESMRDAWDAVVEKLFGHPARSVEARFGDELADAGAQARKTLPNALARFKAGEGELFVWAPFVIPPDDRADGGPEDEWLWVKVASCDDAACTGALSNRPMFATNIASGRTISVPRAKIADWQLRFRDGGVAGGETVKRLEKTP